MIAGQESAVAFFMLTTRALEGRYVLNLAKIGEYDIA
ncbi:hypothetical protein AWB82_06383 [Caballeronia glebae]|uniref:Uncharacterized protein n=1 Tax=Caballeronia glebae TaxID=1777143 RepID=A0A158D7I5_9BURK|nr:hypothetical protein AWB82_06383 [Caballeronia glebae]